MRLSYCNRAKLNFHESFWDYRSHSSSIGRKISNFLSLLVWNSWKKEFVCSNASMNYELCTRHAFESLIVFFLRLSLPFFPAFLTCHKHSVASFRASKRTRVRNAVSYIVRHCVTYESIKKKQRARQRVWNRNEILSRKISRESSDWSIERRLGDIVTRRLHRSISTATISSKTRLFNLNESVMQTFGKKFVLVRVKFRRNVGIF